MTSKLKLILLAGGAVILPLLVWQVTPLIPRLGQHPEPGIKEGSPPPSTVTFQRTPVGDEVRGLPLISNIQIGDFNRNGRQDILVCDLSGSRITLIENRPEDNTWQEQTLVEHVSVPARATAVDLNQDGREDLVVAILGNLLPDDGVIGRVEYYENTGAGFQKHVLLDHVRRVADVRAADLDGDGDLDLAVAVFGYARGQVLWLENQGDLHFVEHELYSAPGTIHVPIGDFDNDGDLDLAAIVSQDEEELILFENQGNRAFSPRRIWKTENLDLGSAGLVATDLDGDGDLDLLLPAGDNLEDAEAYPQPYHGCFWFENQGNWTFRKHRISHLGGTYAAAAGDLDGDGDQDVVLVSMASYGHDPGQASLVWLENNGEQVFREWLLDSEPIHQITIALGDLNGDGLVDLAAGGLNLRKPFDRMGRVTAWLQQRNRERH